jgi:hypothetical protein
VAICHSHLHTAIGGNQLILEVGIPQPHASQICQQVLVHNLYNISCRQIWMQEGSNRHLST